LRGHTGVVLNVEYVSDLNYLCTTGADSTLIFWDCASGYRKKNELVATYPQVGLCYNPAGSTMYSGSTKGTIHVWSLETVRQPDNGLILTKIVERKGSMEGSY
jgi:WD40 repeat protein